LQNSNGGFEVVSEYEHKIDVIEVFLAAEAVGEVVAWVDGGEHVAAVGTEEAEVATAPFGGRPVTTEGGDCDGHGQVVAKSAQQLFGDHVLLPDPKKEGSRIPKRGTGTSKTRSQSPFLGSVVGEVGFLLPVGLQKDAVDVVDVDGLVVPDRIVVVFVAELTL
jgi:hypothetical protein